MTSGDRRALAPVRSLRSSAAPWLLGAAFLTAILAGRAEAQPAEPFPWQRLTPETFADPEAFFRQFFGTTPEDKEALGRVTISVAEERRMGGQAAEAYLESLRRQGLAIESRGRDVVYLRQLFSEIVPQMRSAARYRQLEVHVVDSDAVDARCFPGGYLIIFRGLLDFADSEAALVGILGHELAHLDREHLLADMRRIKLAQQAFTQPGRRFDPQQMMSLGRMMMQVFARPFRAEDEVEADRDGATWAFERGYDPREMAGLFFRMSQQDPREAGGREAGGMPAFLRSHPYHRERHRDILQLADQLERAAPGQPLYVGRENLRRRVPREQQRFAE